MKKWTRGRPIGQGSTATVSTAKIHVNGETVAVKSVELTRSNLFQNEQKIHSSIRCPYVIEYKGQDVTVENGMSMYNIFMEYASFGSLGGSVLDEVTASCFTQLILKGLEYLHSNRIVHCDIKPCNVLVTVQGGVKIADFGCAKFVDDVAGSNWPISGTPIYMAPEVARGEQQGFPADVWALGCTVSELVTGQAPWFGASDPVSALYQIGFSDQVPEIPEFMSIEGKDFLNKCLNRDPEQRWSVKQLLQHPFVAETDPDIVTKLNPGHELCSGSPTSVLDSSLGETKWAEDNENPTRLLKFSEERIRMLIESGSSVNGYSAVPSWDVDGGNWVTVRSYSGKEEGDDTDSGKARCTDRVELESLSFEVENYENSFVNYLGDDRICSTTIVDCTGEFSWFNLVQFEKMYIDFVFLVLQFAMKFFNFGFIKLVAHFKLVIFSNSYILYGLAN